MNPSTIARTLPSDTQVFHSGGYRHPSPTKRRRWLHQLLGQLHPIERVVLHMHLQSSSQREIASHLGMTQPGVCYRLRAAKRRLKLLARFPSPPVTTPELTALGFSDRDAQILTRLQSARAEQVARDLGLRWHGLILARARVMREQPNNPPRVKQLLDLVCAKGTNPFYRADRRRVYHAPTGDGPPDNDSSDRA